MNVTILLLNDEERKRIRFRERNKREGEKTMKKVFAIVLALAMLLAVATAFAGSITVQNVLDGETYTAYKILNYTESGSGENKAVSYYLTADEYTSIGSVLEAAGFAFTKSADGSQYTLNNAEDLEDSGVGDVAAYLAEHVTDLGSALGTKTAFTGLDQGYYFVTSTAGSLCALHSDQEIAEVVEKNTVPTIDKTEKTSGNDYTDGPVDGSIGDTVHYQIVVTDGTGTNSKITLTDTMSAGLTYTEGSIKINDTAVADDASTANWTVTVSGQTITIEFSDAYVASLEKDATITVTYDALINADAVVDDDDANENKVTMTYSQQSSEDKVYVETYDFLLKKTDGTEYLPGATFKLYDAQEGGNEIKLAKDAAGYYVDAAGSETIEVDSADGVNVRGLAPGDYYLEEIDVPDGYNKLGSRHQVTITTGATAPVDVTVVNHAGTELPSTGGIGTTIFYVVGGLLVIGAAVILIARRKVNE